MADWFSSPLNILAVLAVLGTLAGLGRFIWSVSRWTSGVDGNLKRVDEDRTSLQSFMQEIRDDIKKIFHRLPPPVAQSASPVSLTDYGRQLAEQLHAAEWAMETAPNVLDKVREMKAFQVHEFCKGYADGLRIDSDPLVFSRAYEHGITDEHMRIVLAIVLRDELIKITGIAE